MKNVFHCHLIFMTTVNLLCPNHQHLIYRIYIHCRHIPKDYIIILTQCEIFWSDCTTLSLNKEQQTTIVWNIICISFSPSSPTSINFDILSWNAFCQNRFTFSKKNKWRNSYQIETILNSRFYWQPKYWKYTYLHVIHN